ncbi:MAG: hypothetical protein IKS20_04640, partial [Victivallales bacterium]|nr:hypothetical protein [Victivallales bacterium]
MTRQVKIYLLLAIAVFTACSTKMTSMKEMQARQQLEKYNQVRAILDKVHSELVDGNAHEANALLAPLLDKTFEETGVPTLRNEVNALKMAIDRQLEIPRREGIIKATEKTMLDETQKKLYLPENYDKTVTSSEELLPIEMPETETEQRFRTKCILKNFKCQNATIPEIAAEIKRASGINVIADDSIDVGGKTLTLDVDNVPLEEVLRYITRNMGLSFYMGENMLWITAAEKDEAAKKAMETRIIRLHHGTVPTVPDGPGAKGSEDSAGSVEQKEDNELQEALELLLGNGPDGANFRIFKDRNIVLIRDTRENIRLAEKVIKEFDKPPYQVSIEARFITVSKDDLVDVGTEITQKSASWTNETIDDSRVGTTGALQAAGYNNSLGKEAIRTINALTELGTIKAGNAEGVGLINFSGVIANRTFDILVTALDKKDSTVTLSIPKVTVMNNRQARIRKGDKLYYFEDYDVESIDRGDTHGTDQILVPSGSPTELPIGLTFDVKVNVGNDGKTILLGLKPEIVELKKWENYLTTGDDDDDDDD